MRSLFISDRTAGKSFAAALVCFLIHFVGGCPAEDHGDE